MHHSSIKYLFIAFLLFLFASNHVLAARSVYESYIVTDTHKIEYFGAFPGGQFGAVMASGDINNDGIDDLIVGSPFASTAIKKWNGTVSIILGKQSFPDRTVDLSQKPADINLYGEYSGDQFGTSLTIGDYNNDGIDDLAIGAYNAFYEGNRNGKVYIIYGRNYWAKNSININENDVDVTFIGYGANDSFGLALETLDLNNDRIDDLLIGAPSATNTEGENVGFVYTYYGKSGGFSSSVYKLSERLADIAFQGQNENEGFGSAISGGYITKDYKTDVVIGAYKASTDLLDNSGMIYIYAGGDFLSNIKTPTTTILGDIASGWFGFSLDVNDIDNDGTDDIAVSSFPYLGDNDDAKVSIFLGGDRFSHQGASFTSSEEFSDITVKDPLGENFLGASVLLSDLNNDNKAEIIIGAPGISNYNSTEEGETYIIYSNQENYLPYYSVYEKNVSSIIHGENSDDWFGFSLGSMDFNNDGNEDLIIGSRYSEGTNGVNNGKVFVLLGYNMPYGEAITVLDPNDRFISRGEFISKVIIDLEIKEKKATYIQSCYDYREFCFFNFTAMSLYDDMQLEPEIILYPDVPPTSPFYEDVLVATMLGLINGYMNEENSPFYPELSISRVQALKVILASSDLVKPMYRFELIDLLGGYSSLTSQHTYFKDVDPNVSHMWWYPTYVNFAVENSIVDDGEFFRPDDNVTLGELESMITRTQEYLSMQNEEA